VTVSTGHPAYQGTSDASGGTGGFDDGEDGSVVLLDGAPAGTVITVK
jgi:hypothetical protein